MRVHRIAILAAAALLTSVAATSCFTGVETTPKITDSDVRRDVAPPAPEDSWLDDVVLPPLARWPRGLEFLVTDSRAARAFNNHSESGVSMAGMTLRYVEARPAVDVTGSHVTDLVFADSLARPFVYRASAPLDSLLPTAPAVPFTVPLAIVDSVKARMQGHTYYVMTSVWRDSRGQAVKARKFIPVEVLDVRPGTDAYPVMVVFADSAKVVGRVLMSVGPGAKRFRCFGSLFSFTDPRLRHRDITPSVWANIVNGRVASGMTRDECRLALGSPVEIIRQPGYSYMREIWRYETGVYLTFEDGVLK